MVHHHQNVYRVCIEAEHWWDYIPFRQKTVHGQNGLVLLVDRLLERGYKVQVAQYIMRSAGNEIRSKLQPIDYTCLRKQLIFQDQ